LLILDIDHQYKWDIKNKESILGGFIETFEKIEIINNFQQDKHNKNGGYIYE
jgi:hypothetical protein